MMWTPLPPFAAALGLVTSIHIARAVRRVRDEPDLRSDLVERSDGHEEIAQSPEEGKKASGTVSDPVLAKLTVCLGNDDFLLTPLPNHMFTRDTSAWVYDGVSVNAMAKPARRREAVHYDAIYRHHPLFAATPQLGAQ